MYKNFKKQFGQNFLQNISKIIEICDIADINSEDNIIEIGPGDGAITEEILNRKAKLLAIEIDKELIEWLKDKFSKYTNLQLLENDILKINPEDLKFNKEYKLISALPYNISKKIINLFLKANNPPKTMTLIMQKEVAIDYTNTKKGKIKFLNILAKTYCEEVVYYGPISKEDFYPIPKVDGGIVKFMNIGKQVENPEEFLKFVKIGFLSPRKKLSSNLSSIYLNKFEIENILKSIDLSKDSRAGELNFNNWVNLYYRVKNNKNIK